MGADGAVDVAAKRFEPAEDLRIVGRGREL